MWGSCFAGVPISVIADNASKFAEHHPSREAANVRSARGEDLQLAQEDTEDTAAKTSRPDTHQPLVHANNNAGSISAKVERGWTLVDSVCAGHPFMRRC